jgi:hypothetical protein
MSPERLKEFVSEVDKYERQSLGGSNLQGFLDKYINALKADALMRTKNWHPVSVKTFSIMDYKDFVDNGEIHDLTSIIENNVNIYKDRVNVMGYGYESIRVDGVETLPINPCFVDHITVVPVSGNEIALSVRDTEFSDEMVFVQILATIKGSKLHGSVMTAPKDNYKVNSRALVIAEVLGEHLLGNRFFDITYLTLLVLMVPGSEVEYFSTHGKPGDCEKAGIDPLIGCFGALGAGRSDQNTHRNILSFGEDRQLKLLRFPNQMDQVSHLISEHNHQLKKRLI